eukprot:comp22365_c0_seq1/m.33329 comp22365_c0_seq1/g.33329  ORF comp22365_c0_seq1/g.33329 comp22365_c0_seq1/m.33329 type:complete len:217 (-) comp22365_c0_seq1:506-1156(-)
MRREPEDENSETEEDEPQNQDGAGEEEEEDAMDVVAFQDLKKITYEETLKRIEQEIAELQQETHAEYLKKLAGLDQKRQDYITSSTLFGKYMQDCVNARYKKEKQSAEQDLQKAKDSLKSEMMQALQEQKRRLEDERNSNDLMVNPLDLPRSNQRKLRYRQNESKNDGGGSTKRRKVAPVCGPAIKHILDEDQIVKDLSTIRHVPSKKGSSSHRRR